MHIQVQTQDWFFFPFFYLPFSFFHYFFFSLFFLSIFSSPPSPHPLKKFFLSLLPFLHSSPFFPSIFSLPLSPFLLYIGKMVLSPLPHQKKRKKKGHLTTPLPVGGHGDPKIAMNTRYDSGSNMGCVPHGDISFPGHVRLRIVCTCVSMHVCAYLLPNQNTIPNEICSSGCIHPTWMMVLKTQNFRPPSSI